MIVIWWMHLILYKWSIITFTLNSLISEFIILMVGVIGEYHYFISISCLHSAISLTVHVLLSFPSLLIGDHRLSVNPWIFSKALCSLQGFTELTLIPSKDSFRYIWLNCKQCCVYRVTLNDSLEVQFQYFDPFLEVCSQESKQ